MQENEDLLIKTEIEEISKRIDSIIERIEKLETNQTDLAEPGK